MRLKIKRETLFVFIGIMLLLITAGFVFYSIGSLVKTTTKAMDEESAKPQQIIRFNFEGLKKLGIIKE